MNTQLYLVETPPRLAATIMLLRDGESGLEVLLLKRHQHLDVHGGVYVFPGGKVDDVDTIRAREHIDDKAHQLAGFGGINFDVVQATALRIAAQRELAEECGVVIENADTMYLHSRWITPQPSTSTKRFDTWFFVAPLPRGAEPRHDDHEIVEALWLPPAVALRRYWDNTMRLAPPQIMSLAALARHASTQEALDAARLGTPPHIQPQHVGQNEGRLLVFPGHSAHSVRTAALCGPSHLIWRNGRYEPAAGFDAFFN